MFISCKIKCQIYVQIYLFYFWIISFPLEISLHQERDTSLSLSHHYEQSSWDHQKFSALSLFSAHTNTISTTIFSFTKAALLPPLFLTLPKLPIKRRPLHTISEVSFVLSPAKAATARVVVISLLGRRGGRGELAVVTADIYRDL